MNSRYFKHLSRLFQLIQFVKCWQILLELDSKRLYESSGKEKESRCLEFTSSTKQEIRHFHVVVVQWRQRNVQISLMHVQSCCFVNLNLSLFCRSRCPRSRRWLKLPNLTVHEPDITLYYQFFLLKAICKYNCYFYFFFLFNRQLNQKS